MTFFSRIVQKCQKYVHKMIWGQGLKRRWDVSGTPHRRYVYLKFCGISLAPMAGRSLLGKVGSKQMSQAPSYLKRGYLPYLIPGGVQFAEGEQRGQGVWCLGPYIPPGPVHGPNVPAQSSAHKQITEVPFVNPKTVFCHLIRKFILFCLQAL